MAKEDGSKSDGIDINEWEKKNQANEHFSFVFTWPVFTQTSLYLVPHEGAVHFQKLYSPYSLYFLEVLSETSPVISLMINEMA